MTTTPNTPRIKLIVCTPEILNSAIQSDEALATHLQIEVPANWTEFGLLPLEYAKSKLTEPGETGWWSYLPVHIQDNTLIGSGGFKGQPDKEGTVELGYEIAPEYRNQGLATEFCKALIALAFADERVRKVIAHTLGEVNGSTAVLKKCGFVMAGVIEDPEDGVVWRWELNRI